MPIDWAKSNNLATTAAAFFGMALGIYNLLIERNKDRAKIKVIPKIIKKRFIDPSTGQEGHISSTVDFDSNYIDEFVAIEIVNLSSFKLRIDTVGFWLSSSSQRLVIGKPTIIDGGSWPRVLDPRDSVTIYASLPDLLKHPDLPNVKSAFVVTSCDNRFHGTNGALRGLVKFAAVGRT